MGQLQNVTMFNGEQFTPIKIVGKRQDSLNPGKTLYANTVKNKVVVVVGNEDVVLTIFSADGSALNIENL